MPPLTRARSHANVGELVARLPPDVLIHIFAKLPREELQDTVAAVCKRWHTVITEPSSLFHCAAVDLQQLVAVPLQPSLQEWIRARAGFLQRLHIVLPPDRDESAALAVGALASAHVHPQLSKLTVNFGSSDSAAPASLLAALASHPSIAHQLEDLRLHNTAAELRHASLGDALRLPRLRVFDLTFISGAYLHRDLLPQGLPRFLLGCSELEELSVANAGSNALVVLPEWLGTLPKLRTLHLGYTGVRNLTALSALTSLESLAVQADGPPLPLRLPPSLAALARLARVDLSSQDVPLELATLPGLTSLALRGLWNLNGNIQAELGRLLGALQLQELGLHSDELIALPGALTGQASLRRLSLADCSVSQLPSGAYLQRLQHLDLRGNPFDVVPPTALAAPQLRELAMLRHEDPLDVRALAGTTALAAAVAALDAKLFQSGSDSFGEFEEEIEDDLVFDAFEAAAEHAQVFGWDDVDLGPDDEFEADEALW